MTSFNRYLSAYNVPWMTGAEEIQGIDKQPIGLRAAPWHDCHTVSFTQPSHQPLGKLPQE